MTDEDITPIDLTTPDGCLKLFETLKNSEMNRTDELDVAEIKPEELSFKMGDMIRLIDEIRAMKINLNNIPIESMLTGPNPEERVSKFVNTLMDILKLEAKLAALGEKHVISTLATLNTFATFFGEDLQIGALSFKVKDGEEPPSVEEMQEISQLMFKDSIEATD